MKIVLLIDAWEPVIGGGQKLFWQLAKGLVLNHCCQVVLVTRALKDKEGKIYNKNEKLFNGKLEIIRLGPPLSWSNLWGRLWFSIQAAIYVLIHQFDLVHASAFLPGISLQIIKIFKDIPVTFSVIGLNRVWQETNPGITGYFLEKVEAFLTQKLNYSYVITDDNQFFQDYKKGRNNITFIPNGVEIPSYPKVKKWPNFTFLFVGRLDKRKGVGYLLRALKIVKRKYPKVNLRIVGAGPEEKNYKNLAKKIFHENAVDFIGRVTDRQLRDEYTKAHCFVLPSLWEGHPLVLFEAWSFKLPVIVTKVGSLDRFVNSQNGYLVPPQDEKKLAQAMFMALENKNLSKMGENGFCLIKDRYSWEKTVGRYFQVFKNFLQ